MSDNPTIMPVSKYWTVFSLYDPSGELNTGRWRVPLYSTPTIPNVQVINVLSMQAATPMELLLRVGEVRNIQDANFRSEMALRDHYTFAPYHKPYQGNIDPFE
jgi:hypothetical protein